MALFTRTAKLDSTHYAHHQVSLMVSRNTTLVPSLGLCIGPGCEAGLSAGMQREHVPPQIRKKERKKERRDNTTLLFPSFSSISNFQNELKETLCRTTRVLIERKIRQGWNVSQKWYGIRKWSGIRIRIVGLIQIQIWMSPGLLWKCCGFINLLASVILSSFIKVGWQQPHSFTTTCNM